MKFGKIKAENVSHDALSLGGAVAGGALSGGLMTFVPAEQELLARGGMAVIGLAGAASLKAKSSAENLVKFALLGIGIAQGSALIKHFASKQISINETSTASQKFVGGMVGLACPCDQPALGSPVIDFGALRNPQGFIESEATYQDNTASAGAF